jgi:hypothetical protein
VWSSFFFERFLKILAEKFGGFGFSPYLCITGMKEED